MPTTRSNVYLDTVTDVALKLPNEAAASEWMSAISQNATENTC